MRPSRDQWGLGLAQVTAQRGTCRRRQVGCVLLDGRGQVLATGYNGRAAGLPHCNEERWGPPRCEYSQHGREQVVEIMYPNSCLGANSPSGTNLDGCEAIHAEQNALLQCRDVQLIHTCYVTTSPCVTCTKLLLNTSCERIVFAEEYPQKEARQLWEAAGREWIRL